MPAEPGAAPRGVRAATVLVVVAFVLLIGGAIAGAIISSRSGDSSRTDGPAPTSSSSVPRSASTTASSTSTSATTTTAAPTTTTTTAPPPPVHGPRAMTLAFAGDLLPHLPLVAVAGRYGASDGRRYDFDPMLAPMRPIIEGADLAICHLETPVARDQAHLSGYPAFGAPVELVDTAKRTGYDGCSTASNHSLDQGRAGIAATLDRFDLDGLRHAGTARSAQEAATPTIYDVRGAKVAHLSYAYGFNGYPVPRDAPFAVNQIDVDRIHADAHRARLAGAQLVVVSLHWGTEYQHEPNAFQRDVAARLLPSPDIDVIVGHHAHVVQPIEQIAGTYVVWGLGNQLANQPAVPKSDGLTVVLHAEQQPDDRYRITGIEAIPTFIEPGTFRVLPIVRTLADPSTPSGLRRLLADSYDRTAAVLATRPTPGVVLAPRP